MGKGIVSDGIDGQLFLLVASNDLNLVYGGGLTWDLI